MAYDLSIIKPAVAERNGLDYFEVVIFGWGDINNLLTSPTSNALAINLSSAVAYTIPNTVSVYGAAIGPLSTVDTVQLQPDFARFSGITNAPSLLDAGLAYGTGSGAALSTNVSVSVQRPLIQTMPGPISIVATLPSRYANKANGGDNNNQGSQLQYVNLNGTVTTTRGEWIGDGWPAQPVLHLLLWLKAPGPSARESKRALYWDAASNVFGFGLAGGDLVFPVSGRRNVTITIRSRSQSSATVPIEFIHLRPAYTFLDLSAPAVERPIPSAFLMQTSTLTNKGDSVTHTFADPTVQFLLVRTPVSLVGPDLLSWGMVAYD